MITKSLERKYDYDWEILLRNKNNKINEILNSTFSHLLTLKGYDIAAIYLNKISEFQLVYKFPDNGVINDNEVVPIVNHILTTIESIEKPVIGEIKKKKITSQKSLSRNNVVSYILFPLKIKNEHVGIISLFKNEKSYFKEVDIPLVIAFSHHMRSILEKANIFRREQKKSALLAQINNVCQHIDSIMNIDELYNRVVDTIKSTFGYEHVALYLFDERNASYSLKSISGIYSNITPSNQTLKLGQGIVGWVIQTGETILSNDTKKDPHFYNITPDKTPTQSELCVPIKIENRIIGALNIESRELMDFDEDDINLMEVLSNRVGVAIQNSKLYQEVNDNNQRLYDIVSSMGQGIITINKEFKIVWANKTFSDWGWNISEMINSYCYELFNNQKTFCSGCPAKKTFETNKIARKMIQAKNKKYYQVTSTPINYRSENVIQVLEVFDDVTKNIENEEELKEARRELDHSRYLVAIGELTANIAHEVRNPLNALSNAIDILKTDLKLDGDHKKLIKVVKEESTRVNNIISHYLKFASSPKLILTLNKIEKIIQETLILLKIDKNISKDIEFLVYFQSRLPRLLFDRNSIKQVFWNLIKNSIEAIPYNSKGIIKIEVRKKEDYIEIRICDNGNGISPDNLNKIYEPFYSLKTEGTGLGLSIVRSIIERHQWSIELKSHVGKGTIVTINAPITTE